MVKNRLTLRLYNYPQGKTEVEDWYRKNFGNVTMYQKTVITNDSKTPECSSSAGFISYVGDYGEIHFFKMEIEKESYLETRITPNFTQECVLMIPTTIFCYGQFLGQEVATVFKHIDVKFCDIYKTTYSGCIEDSEILSFLKFKEKLNRLFPFNGKEFWGTD